MYKVILILDHFFLKYIWKKFPSKSLTLLGLKLFMIFLKKRWKRGDISSNILDYFNIKYLSFVGSTYCLKFIKGCIISQEHLQFLTVAFCTDNVCAFLELQLKPIALQIKSNIKDTNEFLKKLKDLQDLREKSMFVLLIL